MKALSFLKKTGGSLSYYFMACNDHYGYDVDKISISYLEIIIEALKDEVVLHVDDNDALFT